MDRMQKRLSVPLLYTLEVAEALTFCTGDSRKYTATNSRKSMSIKKAHWMGELLRTSKYVKRQQSNDNYFDCTSVQ